LYGILMKHRGRDFQVGQDVRINGLENLSVGDHVYFAPGVIILADHDIFIGSEVMISFYTVITDGNHTLKNKSYRYGPRENGPIHIGYGSWIGANCTIVGQVNIGKAVVIAANSAVVKDIPDNVIAGGVPAQTIREIF
jgi:acetyltransferase-like isoleucine patch superfamily enzyme